jgi:hypothetical protein
MKNKKKNMLYKLSSGHLAGIKSRLSYGSLAVAFILSILAPLMLVESAAAYGQVTTRSVELSNTVVSATSVKYTVGFTTATTGVIQGVVVDFCSNDPIIGDSCTAPAGFTVGTTVTSANTGLNPTASASWTPSSVNTGRTFEFVDASGASVTAGAAITFEITGNTNPSTLGSYYARILTFATAGAVTTWNSTANGSATIGVVDAGGVALSTTQSILITSKVQEVITFCVYTSSFDGPLNICSAVSGSSVALGNNNGVLSTSGPFVDNTTKYDIQTNALHNVTIRFTAPSPYGTLSSGTNVIAATPGTSGMGATGSTAYGSTSGSPQFGLCNWSAGGTTANLVASAPYNDANCHLTSESATTSSPGGDAGANFAFNISNAESTYGDTLSVEAPGSYAQGEVAFIGNISNTTVAGIYTTTLTFIATGQY